MAGKNDDLRKQSTSNRLLEVPPKKFAERIPFLRVSKLYFLAIYAMTGTIMFCSFRIKIVDDPDSFTAPEKSEPKPLPRPAQFEHEPLVSSTNETSRDNFIDWSDTIFSRHGWDNDPIVIEAHKLLFFTIPKNACSTFKKLFRRMMGCPNWLEGNPHNPETNGLQYFGHYSREQQKEFMTSPNWTRAIFVRDPLERVLSAYMDKGLTTGPAAWQPPVEGAHLKRHCCKITKIKNPACRKFPLVPYNYSLTVDNFPFELFVTSFMRQCKDEHWKQQSLRMRKANWKWINFVGHFESIQDDTRRLLERFGVYDEFGSTGWGQRNNESLSIFETNIANHRTGSRNKMKDHYLSKVERLVLQHYRLDYSSELFNITKPVDYTQKLFGRKSQNRNISSAETNLGINGEARKFTPELIH